MAHRSPPVDLIGRHEELARIVALLASAREGMGGALVLCGEAGIGKTTLLDATVAAADGFTVVRADGVETQDGRDFAALHGLIEPFADRLATLPGPQRHALEATFGVGGAGTGDRFHVGLGLLTLLDDVARDRPLLCVVDDAQWIDRETFEALGFVGRRLHADRIVLLLAVRRDLGGGRPPPEGLPQLDLAGLSDDDARRLLAAVVDSELHAAVARRIVQETQGSPMAIVEVAASLSPDQLAGAGRLPDLLPLGDRLEAHFRSQVGHLPAPTRELLVVAAAEPSGDPLLLWRAVGQLGLWPDAAEPAVQAGLITTSPRVGFRHPLVRSAIYRGASDADRRRAHRALAEVCEPAHVEVRAWHLAAAADEVDEQVAADLIACADRARDRGGFAAEAAFRTRAAELTTPGPGRAARQLAAAQAHLIAGATPTAAELLAEAEPFLDDPRDVIAARRLDAALQAYMAPGSVPSTLLDAARRLEPIDPAAARATFGEAVQSTLVSWQLTTGTTPAEVADAALRAPREPGRPTLPDLLRDGFAARIARGYAEGLPLLREALGLMVSTPAVLDDIEPWVVLVNNLAAELWDPVAGTLRAIEARERERGALEPLRITLGGLAHHAMWMGRFEESDALHSEATEISIALGADAATWETLKVELLAWKGDAATTRATGDLLTSELAEAFGAGIAGSLGRVALSVLDQAEGRHAEALEAAWTLFQDDMPPHGNRALPEVVEAGVRVGAHDEAARALARLDERARASGTDWALGLLARSRALLGGDEPDFLAAVDHLRASGIVTELMRAHLLYGEWLVHRSRPADARAQLTTAHDGFARMGAGAFAARAERALAEVGVSARPPAVGATTELSAHELRVARLAARGDTNREIAAQLFVSASTVDYHLRKVFRKLGIASRNELREALPAD